MHTLGSYITRGVVVGAVVAAFGAWSVWRGVTGNVPRDLFDTPYVPRWLWLAVGLVTAAGGLALVWFLMRQLQHAPG